MLEQHPVPQNVTNFQFRLIGDMTLKQFGYLAGGAILAYIAYSLPLPFFFTYPLAAIFGLGGIGFAFVPVEERPMDVWFLSFIKSIYSPTQYLWQREASYEPATVPAPQANLKSATLSPFQKLSQAIGSLLPAPPTKKAPSAPVVLVQQKAEKKAQAVQNYSQKPQPAYVPAAYPTVMASTPIPAVAGTHLTVQGQQNNQPATVAPTHSSPPVQSNRPAVPAPNPLPINPDLEKRLKMLEEQLEKEKHEKQKLAQMQEQLVTALNDKQKLEQEVTVLRQQMQQKQQTTPTKHADVILPTTKSESVKIISPQAAVFAGMPSLSKNPNVVSGIVKEPNGNLLVGILVTVKDKDDIPVRALKTNKLGQFAASTPLSNGTYTIEAEDPRKALLFDIVKVTLTGGVVPPVEIMAKTKQQLERQKLEQALFGNKP
jgi:hypothetical protein